MLTRESCLLVLIILGCGHGEQEVADFQDTASCGRTYHLDNNASVKVIRNDETSGYCGFLFHAMTDDMYTCPEVCVRVEERSISDCHARLTLNGIKFVTTEAPPKEMTCFERLPDEMCFDTSTLRVELIRDLQYPHAKLNISFVVSPKCLTTVEAKRKREEMDAETRRKHSEETYNSMVKGIVTGVCLCSIFLLVLLLTWCYYQNSSNRGKRYDYPSAKISKRPTLAGFKARMNFRNSRNAEAKSEEAPSERYTVTNETSTKVKQEEDVPLIKTQKEAEEKEACDDATENACAKDETSCDPEKAEPCESNVPEEYSTPPAEVDYAPATIETTCTDVSSGGDGGCDVATTEA
ncbi:uncharacterized protein LOC132555088 [Ylistrum balloti]|uniref:uncharacterized protein LOC132555088 n=1 Tax=Ylistrum balloti TaxID=509963 RepID=UPI002905A4EF|nr:uncharacterized protein LOC132555088 [Ylistrum balloti]XP_060075411.1 uncharacterized protein LOC132555088 [Ylistrum balloti]